MEIEKTKPQSVHKNSTEPTSVGAEPKDFRQALSFAFIKKVSINKSYSLRAFAKFLNIHFATLSHLLSGKRAVTAKTILQVGPRLGLTEKQIEKFLSAAKKNKAVPSGTKKSQNDFNVHSNEAALFLQDWYHDAILELIKTISFKDDFTWIAKKLDISVEEARAAFERLDLLGLIKKSDAGQWENTNENNSTQISEINTSAALRKYQKDLLEKSATALELIPVEERSHSSLVVALNSDELDEVREIIRKFRRDINRFATREGSTPDQVYAFTISGFPISKK